MQAKTCSTGECNAISYALQKPRGCEFDKWSEWGPCESNCGADPLQGTRRRFQKPTPNSSDRGCEDKVEEQPCTVPDPTGALKESLRSQLKEQLPQNGQVLAPDGGKFKVAVKLNVEVTYKGKDGKICPTIQEIEI